MTKDEIKLQIYRDIKEGVGGDYGFFSVGFDFGYNQAYQQSKELQENLYKESTRADILQDENVKLQSKIVELEKDNEWISVDDRLPDCWSQHNKDYASGYILGYTKYKEIIITQLWNNKEWENDEYDDDFNYITHWKPLPQAPTNK